MELYDLHAILLRSRKVHSYLIAPPLLTQYRGRGGPDTAHSSPGRGFEPLVRVSPLDADTRVSHRRGDSCLAG